MTTPRYPFRFYGRRPVEWAEGANAGHGFSVRFANVPDDADLAAIAAHFERRLATGNATPASEPWRWSGPVAGFYVGERWRSRGEHVSAVAAFLRAVHETVLPVEDVVYQGAKLVEDHGWDGWSMARSSPSPGPGDGTVSLVDAFRRPLDEELPAAVPHDGFEAAREATRQAIAAEKVADAVAKRARGKLGLARCADAPAAPSIEWHADPPECFEIPDAFPSGSWHDETGDIPVWGFADIPLVWRKVDGAGSRPRTIDVAWVDEDGTRRSPTWPEAPDSIAVQAVSFSPATSKLLVNPTGGYHVGQVSAVSIPDGAVETHGWIAQSLAEKPLRAAWTARGERIVVLSTERIYLFDPRTEPMTELDSAKAGYSSGFAELASARGGDLMFIYSRWGTKTLAAFACVGDRLHKVANVRAPVWFDHEFEDRIVLGAAGSVRYEVTHVDEVMGTLETKVGKAAAKAAALPVRARPAPTVEGRLVGPARVSSHYDRNPWQLDTEGFPAHAHFAAPTTDGRRAALLLEDPDAPAGRRNWALTGVWMDSELRETDLMPAREAYTTPGLVGSYAGHDWIHQRPEGGPVWSGGRTAIGRADPADGSLDVLDFADAELGRLSISWALGPDALLVLAESSVTEWRRDESGWGEHARIDGTFRRVVAVDDGALVVLTEPEKRRVWFVTRSPNGFGKPAKLDQACDELEVRRDDAGHDRLYVRQTCFGLGRILRAGAWELVDTRRS